MAMYYIKDLANPKNKVWSDLWFSLHKQDLKPERDRLNKAEGCSTSKFKRFVIGEMR